MNNIVNNSNS